MTNTLIAIPALLRRDDVDIFTLLKYRFHYVRLHYWIYLRNKINWIWRANPLKCSTLFKLVQKFKSSDI